jgi:hypothetical protein
MRLKHLFSRTWKGGGGCVFRFPGLPHTSGSPADRCVRRCAGWWIKERCGHLVNERLPGEVRAPRRRRGALGTFASLRSSGANLDEVDFLRTPGLRQAIHPCEGGVCFYCLRRLYRQGRLSAKDLSERLLAVQALSAAKLRPQVSSKEDATSGTGDLFTARQGPDL